MGMIFIIKNMTYYKLLIVLLGAAYFMVPALACTNATDAVFNKCEGTWCRNGTEC